MHTVSVTRTIEAPLRDVWAVLDDFGGVARYNPDVETSWIVDGPDTGEGATRACRFYDGGRVEERIRDYERDSGYTVEFIDVGEMPLKENVVSLALEDHAEAETTVTMTATFTPKYGPLGWVMGKLLMESKFRETFENVLDGLDTHVRTGQRIGERVESAAGDPE